jgi:SPX domain protein involved in polyphosphate accumulation
METDDDIQSKINNVNSLFDNMISQYKSNYINYHKNVTLSMPTSTTTTAGHVSSDSHAKDLNDEVLLNYRVSANNLLEKVRSQMHSNSRKISKINANITPVQTKYLSVLELGDKFDYIKSAAVSSLDDYNELYKTTFFSIIMYLVGSTSILYLLFRPKLQSV